MMWVSRKEFEALKQRVEWQGEALVRHDNQIFNLKERTVVGFEHEDVIHAKRVVNFPLADGAFNLRLSEYQAEAAASQ